MLKTLITATLIAALAVLVLPKPAAYAGDKEWATAGKILAGAAALAIIHEVATSHDNDRVIVERRYGSVPIRRVQYVRSPQRVWVPGHYEVSTERHWVEGWWEQVLVPAEYQRVRLVRYDEYGRAYTAWKNVLVQEAHYERVWHEGYWETREVREWVPGYWEYR
jgi:hypothetical protein